jgi:hypothetical protein
VPDFIALVEIRMQLIDRPPHSASRGSSRFVSQDLEISSYRWGLALGP